VFDVNDRCDPVFARYDGFTPAQGSCAVDTVTVDPEAGPIDFFGNPRVAGAAADQGAVESSGSALPAPVPLNVSVGGYATTCPGGCTFFGALGLAEALRAAPPGASLVVYDHELTEGYVLDHAVIDRPMTLLGSGLGTALLVHAPGDVERGMLTVTQAEGVHIEGLVFVADAGAEWAVWVDPGTGISGANDATIVRNIIVANSSSDVEGFAFIGNGTSVRHNLAVGKLETFVEHEGTGAEVMFNTLVSDDTIATRQKSGFRLDLSDGLTIANNLIDFRAASDDNGIISACTVDEATTTNLTMRDNRYYNVQYVDEPGDIATNTLEGNNNCTTESTLIDPTIWCDPITPRFADPANGDYTPALSSAAAGQGEPSDVLPGEVDLHGTPVSTTAPTIGAVEAD
jgi:hypothetical protein